MMNEIVSIIIPVYNRENLIKDTLESIKMQSYCNWECIIVDDGSVDKTVQIIGEFVADDSRFKLLFRPNSAPKGANSCRNFGYTQSIGTLVNWFDSDDIMHQDFILKKVEVFKSDIKIDLVLSKTVKLDINKNQVFENRTNITDNLLEDYIRREVSWYMPDGMFRKNFFTEENIFDSYLKGGQDRDFYISALIRKPKVVILDFYATFYIMHSDSISEILYRRGGTYENYIYSFSHFESLVNQIHLLKKNNLLSEKLKNHYFIEIKKKIPCIFKIKKKTFIFYKTLFTLSSANGFYFIQWTKLLFASTTFLLFGKGEKLLK